MMDNNNQQAPDGHPHGEKKVGPIIACLIVVLVLIIAALYIFASRINQSAIPDDSMDMNDSAYPVVKPVTSTSTDVNSIQKDLNNSTTGLDKKHY